MFNIRKIILIVIILNSSSYMQTGPDFEWTYFYGGNEYDAASSMTITSDNNYVIVGNTYSYGSGYSDVYLLKVNNNGDTLWTKTYGGSGWDYGSCVVETSDNGLIIAGANTSFGQPSWNVYIIRTDVNGDTLWTRTFQNNYDCRAHSIIETSDGGFLAVGYESWFSPGGGGSKDYIVKIDENGNLQWSNSYIGGIPGPLFTYSYGYANDVCETNLGEYLIVGGHEQDLTILKIAANGDFISTIVYPSGSAYSIIEASDGNYALSGVIMEMPPLNNDILLMKIDVNGDFLWYNTYNFGYEDRGYSLIETSDHGFAIFGSSMVDPYTDQSRLVKTDEYGNLIWSYNLNISSNDRGSDIVQTENGNFIITGYTQVDSTILNGDIYIAKLEPELFIQDNIGTIPLSFRLSNAYPNPFNPTTTIQYELPQRADVQITIYDLLGRKVTTLVNKTQDVGSRSVTWNATNDQGNPVSAGVYLYQITAGEFVQTKKLILLK